MTPRVLPKDPTGISARISAGISAGVGMGVSTQVLEAQPFGHALHEHMKQFLEWHHDHLRTG
jgi:hypothetical protein